MNSARVSWSRPDGPAARLVVTAPSRGGGTTSPPSPRPGRPAQPAEPQSRPQALAGRARVDHPAGGQWLQRADRLPVIAELPVVVVLDHQATPVGHLATAARMQPPARGELVSRGW